MNAKMEPRLNGASSVTNHNDVTDVKAFVFSPQPPALSPEKAMAGSVLRQAAYDLRRFRGATSGVERQLYLDAYDWVTADDFSWPYSFVNICQFLNLAPDVVRLELSADAAADHLRSIQFLLLTFQLHESSEPRFSSKVASNFAVSC